MKNYITLEIKLICRSKRIKQFMILTTYFLFFIYYQLFIQGTLFIHSFFLKTILPMVIALPGMVLSQFFFGIEANYISKTMTVPVTFRHILIQKYQLYCLMSLGMFLLLLPTLFWGVKITELLVSLLLAMGFYLFLGFWSSVLSDKRLDLDARGFANWQGNTIKQYILPNLLLIFASLILYCSTLFFSEEIILWGMSVIGLIFIASSRIWLSSLANYYDKRKHDRIEKLDV